MPNAPMRLPPSGPYGYQLLAMAAAGDVPAPAAGGALTYVLFTGGGYLANLPVNPPVGARVGGKKTSTGGGSITFQADATARIDGSALGGSWGLNDNDSVILVFDGADWWVESFYDA